MADEKKVVKSKRKRFNLIKFLKETFTEFTSRVVWPSKSKTINNTSIVLGFMVVFGAFIAVLDLGMKTLIGFILQR